MPDTVVRIKYVLPLKCVGHLTGISTCAKVNSLEILLNSSVIRSNHCCNILSMFFYNIYKRS